MKRLPSLPWRVVPFVLTADQEAEVNRLCPIDGVRNGKEVTRAGISFYIDRAGALVGIPAYYQIAKLPVLK